MIIGVEFESNNLDSGILKQIFKDFDVTKYTWKVFNEQAWDEDLNNLFENRLYNADEFISTINKPTDLIMLISIYAFDGSTKEINSFEDYINSNCQIMFYVVDCNYLDIYCKREEDLHFFYNKAKELKADKVNYITEDNFCRNGF